MRFNLPSRAVSDLLDVVAEASLSALAQATRPATSSLQDMTSQIAGHSKRAEAAQVKRPGRSSQRYNACEADPAPAAASGTTGSRLAAALYIKPHADRRRQQRFPHSMPCQLQIGDLISEIRTRSIGHGGIMVDLPQDATFARGQRAQVWLDNVGPAEARICNTTNEGMHLAFHGTHSTSFAAVMQGLLLRLETENMFATAHVREMAIVLEQAFERGLQTGHVDLQALMSTRYTLIPGTEPQQFLHAALGFYEDVLPTIQQPFVRPGKGMLYALATDRNGYVPVHNKGFCAPQRPGDLAYNLVYCRNRRLFDDTTTIAAARLTQNPVVQTYLRDTGQGRAALVRSIGVPVMVRGRRWGCAQVAYQMEEN